MNKYWKYFSKLLGITIAILGIAGHYPSVLGSSNSQIVLLSPKPGSIIADILTVEMRTPKQNLDYQLYLLSNAGKQVSIPLVSDGSNWYGNLDTKNFPNENYYLYAVSTSKDTPVIDSYVIQIVIDNTLSSIQSDIKPAYVSSGNMIQLYLYADLELTEVTAELENGIKLNLNYNAEEACWKETYFIPMTYLDRTYVVSFYAKDNHQKSVNCPSSAFTICNAEPVIAYPLHNSQFIRADVQIEGYYKPGETVHLFRKKTDKTIQDKAEYEFLCSNVTDPTGIWRSNPLSLLKGINQFLVSSKKTDYEKVLYPKQKVSVQYFPEGLVVLNYHDIQPTGGTYAKSKEAFERDLKFIKENNFNPVSPTVFLNYLEGKAVLPEKPVLLTFDDGLKGIYQYAYPLLQEYGYQAMLFIIVSRIDNNPDYLTWKEIYEMQSSRVFSIESHTFNSHFFVDDENGRHAALVSYLLLPDGSIESNDQYKKRILDDLSKSKEMIEEKLDKKVHFLSIPFGIGNQSLNFLLKEAGFKGSFTSGGGINPIPFASWDIKRITILNTNELEELVH